MGAVTCGPWWTAPNAGRPTWSWLTAGVVHLRPIRPDDADAVVAFHHRQSPESLYYRYFSPKPSLTAEEVEHLTSADHVHNMAFVAFDGDLLIGIGRYDLLRGGNEAEVAFQADEEHRGRGLATVFLEYLIAAARAAGLDGLVAQVLPDNRRMLKVFERAGFDAHRQFADGVIEVELGPGAHRGGTRRPSRTGSSAPRPDRWPRCWRRRPSR